jgi:hypothetical protein
MKGQRTYKGAFSDETIFRVKAKLPFLWLFSLVTVCFGLYAEAFYIPFAYWHPYRELNSSWTPAWSNIVEYMSLDGPPGAIANGTTIPAAIGGSAVASAAGLSYVSGHIAQAISANGTPIRAHS